MPGLAASALLPFVRIDWMLPDYIDGALFWHATALVDLGLGAEFVLAWRIRGRAIRFGEAGRCRIGSSASLGTGIHLCGDHGLLR